MHTRRALGGRACRSEGLWLMNILHAAYAMSCSLSISILSNGSPLARVIFCHPLPHHVQIPRSVTAS